MTENNTSFDDENDADSDETGEAQLYDTARTTTSRRGFMKMAAAAGGAAVAGGGASQMGYSPVGEAQAVAPLVGVAAYAAAGAIVGAAADYGGFDPNLSSEDASEVEQETADYVHQTTYSSVVDAVDMQNAFLDDLRDETGSSGDRPAAGGLGAIGWSTIRAETYRAMKEGASVTEAETRVQSAFDGYVTDVLKDFFRDWNQLCENLEKHRYNVWRAAANNSNLNETSVFAVAGGAESNFNAKWNGPDGDRSFGPPGSNPPAFSETRSIYQHTLPNGDTVDIRVFHEYFADAANNWTIIYWPGGIIHTGGSASDTSNQLVAEDVLKRYGPVEVNSSYDTGTTEAIVHSDSGISAGGYLKILSTGSGTSDVSVTQDYKQQWDEVYNTIMTFHTNVSSEISNYVSTVYNNFTPEDVSEILTGLDVRREFSSEENTLGGAGAEYVAMGYAGDTSDLGTEVTVETDPSTTADGTRDKIRGVLLMDIDESRLASFEYGLEDTSNGVKLTVNDASLRSEFRQEGDARTYKVTYGSGPSTTEVTAAELSSENTIELSGPSGPSDVSKVERVLTDSKWDGEVVTALQKYDVASASSPADYRNARLVRVNDSGAVERITLDGDIELLEVHVSDRNELTFKSWVDVESDPTLSAKEMDNLLDARGKTVEDLSESGGATGLVGDGGLPIPGWSIGAIIVGALAYYASDDDR